MFRTGSDQTVPRPGSPLIPGNKNTSFIYVSGMNQTQQNGCDYQNSFYSNGFHDMGHGHVVSNMNLANVTSSQSSVYGNGTSNHIAKDQSTSICNLKSTIIDSNESERLSESSESGIGEENTESSSTNSSPNGNHTRIFMNASSPLTSVDLD